MPTDPTITRSSRRSITRSTSNRSGSRSWRRLLQAFAPCSLGEFHERLLQLVEIFLLELLEIQQFVARVADRPDQFIELHLNGFGVAVLSALNQEHHQERDDRRGGVDHQLPRVAETEIRS